MNHAQNALYWRLKQPHTRALASLLVAPPLWDTGAELTVPQLLGEHGFRLLLDWDDHPEKLPENLSHPLLGKYAENLLAFWLDNAPHTKLLARNVILPQGELDFIAQIHGEIHHIELCCKYFGGEHTWRGLNPNDTLDKKRQKIQQQMQTSQHENAQNWLRENGFSGSLKTASVVRGNIFTPHAAIPPECAATAWSGFWFADFAAAADFVAQQNAFSGSRVYHFARHEYLAPACVAHDATNSWQDSPPNPQGICAIVLPRPDGLWHEQARVMFQAA